MGQSFSITATGKDTRSLNNLTAYIPADGDLQKIFLCATTAQVVATASIGVDTPAYGYLKIVKTGENGSALAGVKFGVYSDAGCTKKLCDLTTGSDGTVTSGALPAGSVYVKELSTMENAKAEVEKPFAQEQELAEKTARLAELDALLNIDKRENDVLDAEPEHQDERTQAKEEIER